jgi:hypothetical protein
MITRFCQTIGAVRPAEAGLSRLVLRHPSEPLGLDSVDTVGRSNIRTYRQQYQNAKEHFLRLIDNPYSLSYAPFVP